MAVVEVVPPDLETASAEESVSHHAAITAALTQLGNGWSVWIDQWRRQDRGYLPPSDFGGNHAACLTDRSRRSDFEAGRAVYSNRLYVAVHWVPQGRDATLAYLQDKSPRDRQVILDTFRDGADQLFSELAHQSPSVAMLEGDALATYLAEAVTYRRVPTHLPEAFLAQHLGAADWTTAPSLSIDGLHVRAVEVHTFGRATPLTFQVFHELPFEGRWTTTIHFLDRDDQRRTLARLKSEWAPKRYGMLGHLFEATGWKRVEEAERKDIAAIQRNLSLLEESIADTRDGLVIATVTLRVWDPDPALADDRARIVQGHLNARGWRARVATVNETPGAIADIPGNASRERLNARRPLVQLERIGRASPITGLTDGTREDARLGGPALLVAKSRRQGPLFFSLHAPGHDVGHTLLVGQTGGGKSALMKLMVLQHQRYPGSTQTLFDHRRTAMIATLASDDGQWLELGSGGIGVQPLRDLDSPEGFAWAVDWLCAALALRNVPVDADLDHALVEALSALRGLDHGQRTLSAACAHLGAHRAARDALAHYTAAGPFGLLLDGVVAGYGSARLLCIDYSKVMGMAKSPLILSACFRQVSTERISRHAPEAGLHRGGLGAAVASPVPRAGPGADPHRPRPQGPALPGDAEPARARFRRDRGDPGTGQEQDLHRPSRGPPGAEPAAVSQRRLERGADRHRRRSPRQGRVPDRHPGLHPDRRHRALGRREGPVRLVLARGPGPRRGDPGGRHPARTGVLQTLAAARGGRP